MHFPELQPTAVELPNDGRLLLRAEEAAHLLGVSRATVYNLLASGELRGVKIGRAVRVSRATLLRWIAEREGALP
ncbi:MAG: helix-turn-helix domain-containing protein [Chloroflexota bacterium]|nr:helix-turn-helix domain-containing protein [Chloroflexota bacterium]